MTLDWQTVLSGMSLDRKVRGYQVCTPVGDVPGVDLRSGTKNNIGEIK